MDLEQLKAIAESMSKKSYLYKEAQEGDEVIAYWFEDLDFEMDFIKFAFYHEKQLLIFTATMDDIDIMDRKEFESDFDGVDLKKLVKNAIKLTRVESKSYPSLDYLFYYGPKEIDIWLKENNWEKDCGYNGNFKDPLAQNYNAWWQTTFPIYSDESYFLHLKAAGP
jgi:hypothetical protein